MQSVQIVDLLSLEVKSSSEPSTLTVIEGKFRFGLTKPLVVEIFKTFWNILQSEDEAWETLLQSPELDSFAPLHHTTIVTGQTSIGQYLINMHTS
jgi:hypothetical protein